MSSIKIGRSGRHRESGVWQFYSFDNGTRKSKCTACGRLIAGKNPTNLKSHLKSNHKDRFSQLEVLEADFKKKQDKARKMKEAAKLSSTLSSSGKLEKYFGTGGKKDTWPKQSKECKYRDASLALFTAVSGVPTRIVRNGQIKGDQPATEFWSDREKVFKVIFKVGQDFTASPASQAYCEQIFSICGDLCRAQRNRMEKSLELRVFLKANSKFISFN